MGSKKIGSLLLTAIMMFFLAVMPVSAEVTELWNRTYDGGYEDFAIGVATDGDGNVIVTGHSSDGSTQYFYTIKYDKSGNKLWSRTYEGRYGYKDSAHGVATDGEGNVIVTGKSYENRSTGNYYTTR